MQVGGQSGGRLLTKAWVRQEQTRAAVRHRAFGFELRVIGFGV